MLGRIQDRDPDDPFRRMEIQHDAGGISSLSTILASASCRYSASAVGSYRNFTDFGPPATIENRGDDVIS